MARIRTIKPEFWEDEQVADLPLQSRLLFIGMWNFADDYGILTDSTKWIRAKVFPYDALRDHDVKQWIDALVKNRMLIPFHYGEKGYYVIRRFRAHQIIDKRYEKSSIPTDVVAELMANIEKEITTRGSHGEHNVVTPLYRKGEEMEVEVERRGERKNLADAKPPPPVKKSKKVPMVLFRDSEFFEKTRFAAALFGTQYQEANLDYYHEVILNWSDSKGAQKADWLATAKNWMAKDMTDGKFISKNFKPPINGKKSNNSPAEISVTGAFAKIDAMYSKAGDS